jgi:hypothetical protein
VMMEKYSAWPGGSEPRHIMVSATSAAVVVPTHLHVDPRRPGRPRRR